MARIAKSNITKIKEMVNKLNYDEKHELARFIDQSILEKRFKNFMSTNKTKPVTMKEITLEVESVRSERYK
jgi:hypothetical protein